MNANNINKSTVALNRYSGNAWNKLQTTEMSDDGTVVLYEAISPGLSIFAVSGEQSAGAAAPTGGNATEEKKETTLITPTKGKGIVVVVIVLIVVGAGVVFYLVKKNVIKPDKILKKKENNWDALKEKYSRR